LWCFEASDDAPRQAMPTRTLRSCISTAIKANPSENGERREEMTIAIAEELLNYFIVDDILASPPYTNRASERRSLILDFLGVTQSEVKTRTM
jgi:hypothetical protein